MLNCQSVQYALGIRFKLIIEYHLYSTVWQSLMNSIMTIPQELLIAAPFNCKVEGQTSVGHTHSSCSCVCTTCVSDRRYPPTHAAPMSCCLCRVMFCVCELSLCQVQAEPLSLISPRHLEETKQCVYGANVKTSINISTYKHIE